MSQKQKTIFISAGDPSGDIHASNLMKELLTKDKNLKFVGIGGPEMQKYGLESIVNFEDINVVGFWEVAKKYRFFKQLESNAKKLIQEKETELVILVDYPGLNARLANYSKSVRKKVCYYIAPQLWAWGKKRAKKLAESVDKLLVVFPFEVEYFKEFGMDVEFVGHPLLDLEVFDIENESNRIANQICLIPGSRTQEVISHLKLFSELIRLSDGKYNFVISKSLSVNSDIYKDFINLHPNVKVYKNSREAMKSSEFGIVKAGTSTLEATLLKLPFIMIYKTSFLTFLIGKNIINIDYLSMPNILLKKVVIKELIQREATAENILNSIDYFMMNKDLLVNIENDFGTIRKMLGTDSAKKRASEIIYNKYLL